MGGSGRDRASGRVKRKEVQADDGWTVVTHGLSKSANKHKSRPGKASHATASFPTDIVEGLTAEKLIEDFKRLQSQWRETSLAKQIEDLLVKRTWDVQEAVCVGIGSFSLDWSHRHRSMWQLVLFMAVVEHLRAARTGLLPDSSHPNGIKIYAQEPAFTSLDVEFLKDLGVDVVKNGVERHVSVKSFLYSPFVDWFFLLPTFLSSPTADPVLYVGNDILDDYTMFAQSEEKRVKLELCNELGKRFLGGKERATLGDFEGHANAVKGMVTYWRNAKGEEKDGEDEEGTK